MDYGSLCQRIGGDTVTLASDDASLKTDFLISLCRSCRESILQVHYVDIDLQFSSYLQNYKAIGGLDQLKFDDLLQVNIPDDVDLAGQIIRFLSEGIMQKDGVIVIDSLNSLQNSIRVGSLDSDSVVANHKVAILITLVQQLARHYSKTLWITNISRNRPVFSDGEIQWDRGLAGGRMMSIKSNSVFMLKVSNEGTQQNGINYHIQLKKKDSIKVEEFTLEQA